MVCRWHTRPRSFECITFSPFSLSIKESCYLHCFLGFIRYDLLICEIPENSTCCHPSASTSHRYTGHSRSKSYHITRISGSSHCCCRSICHRIKRREEELCCSSTRWIGHQFCEILESDCRRYSAEYEISSLGWDRSLHRSALIEHDTTTEEWIHRCYPLGQSPESISYAILMSYIGHYE